MIHTMRWCTAVFVTICLLIGPPARAADPKDSGEAAEEAARQAAKAAAREADKAEALSILKRSSDFLAQQKQFSFEAVLGFDALQSTGQKLEFGGNRKVTVRRPDRLRVEAQRRDGEDFTLFFDGEQISVALPTENAYASVKKPGTLDAAIDYLVKDLQTPAPLADFLYSDFYSGALDKVESGFSLGESTIGKFRCQHLAFRGSDVDFQIWIDDGDQPLPRRVVITYKTVEGSPQFWGQFLSWNLRAEAPDSLFAFTPAEGAEQIPFVPRGQGKLPETEAQ